LESARKHCARFRRPESARLRSGGHWFAKEQRYAPLLDEKTKVLKRNASIKFFFEHDTTVTITKK